jgi:hypothetical protein
MDDKDFSLMRKFTGAEGELPCDALGELLSPSEMRLVSSAGFADFVYSAPLAWLDGKPVYPDSLICWKGEQWGTENIDRAAGWAGWKDPACLAFFSWPVEAKKEDLGSGDKYVKKDWPRAGPQAGCPCAFCTKFREEPAARAKPPKTKAQLVQNQLDIQGRDGNWNFDPYMHGLYNGLECALATIEDRPVAYRDAPPVWLRDLTPVSVGVDLSRDSDRSIVVFLARCP